MAVGDDGAEDEPAGDVAGRHAGHSMSTPLTAAAGESRPLTLPASLVRQLDGFRRTVWTIKAIEAVCGAACGVLLAWSTLFVCDRFTETPGWVRWVVLTVAAASATAIPVMFHRWIWRQRTLDRLARLIARRFPALGDQLLGVIEIVRHQVRNEAERLSSRRLCEAAIGQVAATAAGHDLRAAVPRPRHRLWAGLAALPVAAALLVPAVVPEAAANAWARLLMPWRRIERFTFARVGPLPDTVITPHGEPAALTVGLAADTRWRPQRAQARLGGGPAWTADRDGDAYTLSLPPQVTATPLRLAIGDARRQLSVVPTVRPGIVAADARITLPAYLGRQTPLVRDARGGAVSVVTGSEVVVTASASRPLAAATVDAVAVAPDGSAIATPSLVVDGDRTLAFTWQDRLGLAGSGPLTVRLLAHEDQAPAIAAEGLGASGVVLEDDTVRFRFEARDDFGVREAGMIWAGAAGRAGAVTTTGEGATGERLLAAGGPEAEVVDGVGTFSPRDLGIAPQTVEVRLFVEDFRPGRGRVYSPPVVLTVLGADEHALWMNDQIGRWRQQTAEVQDRELELLARNEELRRLPPERLAAPETRQAIREQSAAERANARRLGRLADEGTDLVRQAARNPEFAAAELEELAAQVEGLAGLAATRMPDVGERLQAAAEARAGTASGEAAAEGDRGDQSADTQERPARAAGEAAMAAGESAAEPRRDGDRQGQAGDGQSQPGGGKARSAAAASPPPNPQSSGPPNQERQLADAVEKQRELLDEFARLTDRLTDAMARLEAATFVNRLKSAARSELEVGAELAGVVARSFGKPIQPEPGGADPAAAAARGHDALERKLSAVMDDLDASAERRPRPAAQAVLGEMRELDVLGSLRQLTAEMQREAGVSIAQTEFWSDTLDRWADALAAASPGGGGGAAAATRRGSLPPEAVLEALALVEAQTNLREETRVLDQVRPTATAEALAERAARLAEQQESLSSRVATLAETVRQAGEVAAPVQFDAEVARMKRELLPAEGRPSRFAREVELLERAERAMAESGGLLRHADAGRAAIAAETEAIELLLEAQSGGEGGSSGTAAGASPGGGSEGGTRQAALARLGEGLNRAARADAPEDDQAVGRSGLVLPEEFRAGLDAYFNAFERSRGTVRGTARGTP